ncbi:MAG: class I SAM-dependent methyltransferase [Alphaproteobacteria bacterium]|nr:class I SAM-dependent methyltransferase [Alphaproteobacteria bacterium]MBV9371871.1 class I SAM-dependent methyltransferase [Alphaproteobacteria bacterium]MBV9901318.1 class I SAM-dependent methyltransferase [Alphaproteobacteria bacterium]
MRKMFVAMLALASAAPIADAAYARPPARAAARAPADVAAAVAAPGRPEDQVKLDESRKPAQVLAFEGLKRGDMALDLFTGGGYYAEIMARAVGPKGGVLAWEPANFLDDKGRKAFADLKGRAPNTGLLATPATALSLPGAAFDFVMLHLNYHDTYWESAKYGFPRMDPDAFLRTVFQSMKPGGTMAVIDHVGPAGDTRAVVEKLHRIDPATLRADFERAGFVFEAESNLLRNPADDHSKNVFDPAIRGKTDRIVYRFRKPR